MRLLEVIKTSWRALQINRSRSFLTMLGIIIGISSVIIILSVGASAQNLILNQIRSVGSNLIVIFPGKSQEDGPPVSVLGISVTTLTNEDLDDIRDPGRVSGVEAASGYVRGTATVSYQNSAVDTSFLGVDAQYLTVEDAQVAQGNFFTAEDNRNLSNVAVLGPSLAEELFNGNDPIGQRIKVRKESFTVIGVMEERGPVAFENPDNYIFIPIQTAQKKMLGIDHVNFARVKITEASQIDLSISQISDTLRENHNIEPGEEDDFTIRNAVESLDALTTVTNAIKFFLSAVAAVSLIVGGVGIMNIMFVAITERTREIGLRKALGAAQPDIVRQFIAEAVIISVIGGLIGLVIGISLSAIIAVVIQNLGYDWGLVITPISIILSIGFSSLIGYVFGIYPAYKAAKLNPIEALRYE